MSQIEQLVRIAAYLIAGAVFGDATANSEMFQQALGGAIAIGTFVWWVYRQRQAKSED